ncbi:hypothetical protein ANOM_011405 [Aspergillus nomiae NRRL 13137]|uniref:Ubiquitin 3 binding protein But2 C-terminal domain-containing protein n=1 Tax=Aspergillus nomiae NRRL (strain ATCC 15546 / NRRL 13137 / CBS 260.88 / M93) TaxID=1509407 RepID=A0A0L1IKR9_ASPN3|nr:uncharacterized protein ANOM_011405 [Aspergillus nomiae NRRL 13137]KNG80191.1 hypothetical protein ANOM_011405 [Aspergillus nomiae NRRL 13137]
MNLLLLTFTLLTTLTTATPTPRQDSLLWPYATYRYWVQTGNWVLDPQDQLLVVKNGNAADETTSIVTFDIPATADGHKCKLLFDLWDRDVSTGSQLADVFTATKPTGASASASDSGARCSLCRSRWPRSSSSLGTSMSVGFMFPSPALRTGCWLTRGILSLIVPLGR